AVQLSWSDLEAAGAVDELIARLRAPEQQAAGSPAVGVAQVRHAARLLVGVSRWIAQVGACGDGVAPDVVADVLGGLGAVEAAGLAAVSRGIVLAEESGCAEADGQASLADWVAGCLGVSGEAARRSCRLAADLDGLPAVLEALEAGRIARDHAVGLVDADRQQRRDHDAAERARRAAAVQAAEQLLAAAEAAAADV